MCFFLFIFRVFTDCTSGYKTVKSPGNLETLTVCFLFFTCRDIFLDLCRYFLSSSISLEDSSYQCRTLLLQPTHRH